MGVLASTMEEVKDMENQNALNKEELNGRNKEIEELKARYDTQNNLLQSYKNELQKFIDIEEKALSKNEPDIFHSTLEFLPFNEVQHDLSDPEEIKKSVKIQPQPKKSGCILF